MHIWPRGSFMMVSFPNEGGSWTVTLFMTAEMYDKLKTPEEVVQFFKTYLPDALPLIGQDRLIKDFFAKKPLPLINIKVLFPYFIK